MTNAVCYKLKTPHIINKGTAYEKRYDTFLAYESYKPFDEVECEVEYLNRTKPAKLWNGEPIDWNKVDYFYVNRQEAMY